MPKLKIDDQEFEVDGDGFLQEPGVWDEDVTSLFAKADGIEWDELIQFTNIDTIIKGIRNVEYLGDEDPILPRQFVYPYCRFLEQQKHAQREISVENAEMFINTHVVPESEEGE